MKIAKRRPDLGTGGNEGFSSWSFPARGTDESSHTEQLLYYSHAQKLGYDNKDL